MKINFPIVNTLKDALFPTKCFMCGTFFKPGPHQIGCFPFRGPGEENFWADYENIHFDGLMTPGRVKEARGQYEQARIETRDTRRTVLLSIKQAYLDLKAAQKAIDSHRETVGQAEKAYQIARIRWKNGMMVFIP